MANSEVSSAPETISSVESKKPQRPNKDEYNAKLTILRQNIVSLQEKLAEIDAVIHERRKCQGEYNSLRRKLRKDLDNVTAQIQDLETQKKEILLAIEFSQKNTKVMKTKVQAMKRTLGFQTEEEISSKIRLLERQLLGMRLSVQDENKIIAQIRQLQSAKPLLTEYKSMENSAAETSLSDVLRFRESLDSLKTEIKECQEKKKKLLDSLHDLVQKNQDIVSPLRDLADEKESVKRDIVLQRQEEARVAAELARETRQYNEWLLSMNREHREKIREERIKREAEMEKDRLLEQLEDLELETFPSNYFLCKQTIKYLEGLVGKSNEKSKEIREDDTKEIRMISSVYETEIALPPKSEREPLYYFQPIKKKGTKKSKKFPPAIGNTPLVHDIRTLMDFDRLSVQPPRTLDDCETCLKIVQTKMDELETEKANHMESVNAEKASIVARLDAL